MPTRPSAPTSSSWIWRMPLANSPPPCSSAARRASSRWSSAGSSSLASLAMPAVGRRGGLARGALAEVLEVRLRALGEREVLRGLVVLRRRLRVRSLLGLRQRLLGGGDLRLARRAGPPRGSPGRPPPRRSRPPAWRSRRSSRLVVHDLGVDDLLLGLGAVAPAAVGGAPFGDAACCCAWARSYIASETLWNAVCRRSVLALDVGRVLGGQRLADVLDRGLDLASWRRRRPGRPAP